MLRWETVWLINRRLLRAGSAHILIPQTIISLNLRSLWSTWGTRPWQAVMSVYVAQFSKKPKGRRKVFISCSFTPRLCHRLSHLPRMGVAALPMSAPSFFSCSELQQLVPPPEVFQEHSEWYKIVPYMCITCRRTYSFSQPEQQTHPHHRVLSSSFR